ncbi:hypothetical protein EON65_13425 [archaeon]|nr:MAG: hypothetical protein EON65_13425 [archaeon]
MQLIKNYDNRLADIEDKNSRLTMLLTSYLNGKNPLGVSVDDATLLQHNHQANGISPVEEPAKNASLNPVQVNQVPEEDDEGSISDLSTPSNKIPTNVGGSALKAPPLATFFQEDVPGSAGDLWGSLEEANESGVDQEVLITTHMQEMLSYLSSCSAEAEFAVDAIVKLVQPHDSQIVYRESAMNFIKRQIKFALNSLSFETAFVNLRCFLPGDPICLTLIIPQNQLSFWQTSLMDRFKVIIDAMTDGRYHPGDEVVEEGGKSPIRHTIRSLSSLSDLSGNKVVCAVDAIDVQISMNNRLDLCMNAFFEEFDTKVGKNHLFKCSLLLLRAWWTYESLAYGGPGTTQVKHYLPEQALAVMLVMVFNQYSQQIKSPLQALVLFFAEYAKYNPDTSVITLQGVVPFSGTSAYPALESVQRHHVIDTDMAEKFWLLFNVDAQPSEQMGAARPTSPGARHRSLFSSMSKALEKFERNSFNVLHPFTHANMMQEKVSSRRVGIVKQIFQSALQSLTSAIRAASENAAFANDVMGKFFPSVLGRFTNDYRPDAVSQSLSYIR